MDPLNLALFRVFIFAGSVGFLVKSACASVPTFAARAESGLRAVLRSPLETSESLPPKVWGTQSQEFLHPLGHLGLAFECLHTEYLRREGFLSMGVKPSGSLQLDIFQALGEALYVKHPWDNFARAAGFSQKFVWERSVRDSNRIFDPQRVYAPLHDWVVLTRAVRASQLCQDKLSESSALKKIQDESSIYWVDPSGSFLGWNGTALWAALVMGNKGSPLGPKLLVDALEAEIKKASP